MGTKGLAHTERSSFDYRKGSFYEAVGRGVRAARNRAGLSIDQLAAKCGLSSSTIDAIDRGRTCSLPALALIADVLNTRIDELVTPDGFARIAGRPASDEAAQ